MVVSQQSKQTFSITIFEEFMLTSKAKPAPFSFMFYKHTDLLIGVKINKKKKSQKKDILIFGLKSYFWVKSLMQSTRKTEHHPLGCSGIWIHAMLCVKVSWYMGGAVKSHKNLPSAEAFVRKHARIYHVKFICLT